MIRYLFREEVYLIDGEKLPPWSSWRIQVYKLGFIIKGTMFCLSIRGRRLWSDVSVDSKLQAAAEVLLDIAERHLKPLSQGSGTLEKIGDKRRG